MVSFLKGVSLWLPLLLTMYLIFYQTQRLWVKKRYALPVVLTAVFAILWTTFIDRQNGYKISLTPFWWVTAVVISQLIHVSFSSSGLKGEPIVFVKGTRFSNQEHWSEKVGREPNNLDRALSAFVLFLPFLLLIALTSFID